jgi:hypothetical protein
MIDVLNGDWVLMENDDYVQYMEMGIYGFFKYKAYLNNEAEIRELISVYHNMDMVKVVNIDDVINTIKNKRISKINDDEILILL